MGRPKLAEHRDKPIVIRRTPPELALLKATAFVRDMTEAGCARVALIDWLRQQATTTAVSMALEARETHDKAEAETHSLVEALERRAKTSGSEANDEAESAG